MNEERRSRRGFSLTDCGDANMRRDDEQVIIFHFLSKFFNIIFSRNIFIFNPKSPQDVIKAAFDYVIYSNFNLDVLESNLATQAASGQVVGAPNNVLFTGAFQQKINALTTKYANVPLQNYASFTSSTVALRPEPRKQTQKMYAALDPVMQAVLTNSSADPQTLLNQAAQQFQQILDQSTS